MDEEIFKFLVRLLLIRTLYDKTAVDISHAHSRVSLTCRQRTAITRAAVSYLKAVIISGLVPSSFLRYKFGKAVRLVLNTAVQPSVCKAFTKSTVELPCITSGMNSGPLRLYVDIEGTYSNPVEITLLFASGKVVLEALHLYGIPTAPERKAAPFSHCMFHACNASKTPQQLRRAVHLFLQKYAHPSEIVVNGVDDIRQFFQHFLKINEAETSFTDVGLPHWEYRPLLVSHQLAVLAKERHQNPPPLNFNCNIRKQHTAGEFRRKATVATLTQLSRSSGCHCSLYDVMELFYYVENISLSINDVSQQ